MINMKVTYEESKAILRELSEIKGMHKRYIKSWEDWENRWKSGGEAGVTAQSICWLACWAKSGEKKNKTTTDAAEKAFNEIFNQSYDQFSYHVPYEWAEEHRYKGGDIESELIKQFND
jgi:hypothetical protein